MDIARTLLDRAAHQRLDEPHDCLLAASLLGTCRVLLRGLIEDLELDRVLIGQTRLGRTDRHRRSHPDHAGQWMPVDLPDRMLKRRIG